MSCRAASLEPAASWCNLIQRQGLLRLRPTSPDPARLGVSLAYLEALAASLIKIMPDESTGDVWHQLVVPELARASGKSRFVVTVNDVITNRHHQLLKFQISPNSLISLVPESHTGSPQWFVSHVWSGRFEDLVNGLQQELAPEPGPTKPALPAGFKNDIFVWIGETLFRTK